MTISVTKNTLLATLATVTLGFSAVPASADIEDWLRRTFSSTDYVGDWLYDVFGPVQNNGSGFDTPSIHLDGYKEAVMIMQDWKYDRDGRERDRAEVNQICSGKKLLHVILETKSQSKTVDTCFK